MVEILKKKNESMCIYNIHMFCDSKFCVIKFSYLCRYRHCRYILVLIGYCSPTRPIHRSICIAIRFHCLLDTARAPNNCLDILRECSVCRSSPWHTNKCHFCIGRARCNGRRTISYCSIGQTNPNDKRKCLPHNGRVHHNPNHKVLRHDSSKSNLPKFKFY